MQFCSQASLPTVPTSKRTLLLFASDLATQNLSHSTIKVYTAAVHSVHVTTGYHTIFDIQSIPCLDWLLKGIRKEKAKTTSPKVRLPIITGIMADIKRALDKQPKTYHNTMMWAACCVAFFGFLHSSEFTVPSPHQYDSNIHLSLADITVDNRHALRQYNCTLRSQKQTPLDKRHSYIWKEPTTMYDRLKQPYHTLQLEENTQAHYLSCQTMLHLAEICLLQHLRTFSASLAWIHSCIIPIAYGQVLPQQLGMRVRMSIVATLSKQLIQQPNT